MLSVRCFGLEPKEVANSGINNTLAQKKVVSLKTPPRFYFLSYTCENLICYRSALKFSENIKRCGFRATINKKS